MTDTVTYHREDTGEYLDHREIMAAVNAADLDNGGQWIPVRAISPDVGWTIWDDMTHDLDDSPTRTADIAAAARGRLHELITDREQTLRAIRNAATDVMAPAWATIHEILAAPLVPDPALFTVAPEPPLKPNPFQELAPDTLVHTDTRIDRMVADPDHQAVEEIARRDQRPKTRWERWADTLKEIVSH